MFDVNQFRINRFTNPFDFLRIGLFDLWVCNEDRSTRHTNILLSDTGQGLEFYAIDHELTFASSSFDELTETMQLTWDESILNSDFVKKVLSLFHFSYFAICSKV